MLHIRAPFSGIHPFRHCIASFATFYFSRRGLDCETELHFCYFYQISKENDKRIVFMFLSCFLLVLKAAKKHSEFPEWRAQFFCLFPLPWTSLTTFFFKYILILAHYKATHKKKERHKNDIVYHRIFSADFNGLWS